MENNFTNTSDIEFNFTFGDVSVSVLFVRYPIDSEEEGGKPRHFHDYYELVFVEDGNAVFETDEEEVTVSNGEIVIESPKCEHKFYGIEKCKAYKFGFSFTQNRKSSDRIYKTVDDVFSRLVWKKIKDDGKVAFIVSQFLACIGKFAEPYRMNALFTELIFTLYDSFAEKFFVDKNDKDYYIFGRNAKDIITNALLYYYSTDLTVQEVSQKVFLCPRQINRICKKIYGRTFNEQKTYFRIENAKKLLKKSDKKMIDIYLECGFSSMGSFYAAFKKSEGVSPKKYRKNFLSLKNPNRK